MLIRSIQALGLVALILTGALLLPRLETQATTKAASADQGSLPKHVRPPHAKRMAVPQTYAASHREAFTLSASFYDLRGRWTSRLTLNNKGAGVMRPRVTLYSAGGAAYSVPQVTVPANGFIDVDLGPIARAAGPDFQHGSIGVVYYGKHLEMGAQVLVRDEAAQLQFDEQLSYAGGSAANRREAIWWVPSARARLSVILTNRGEEDLVVRTHLSSAAPDPAPPGRRQDRESREAVRLRPHELRVVEIPPGQRLGDHGGVTIEHDGSAGAVAARVLVLDPAAGYSASIPFSDPATSRSAAFHGGGFRVNVSGRATRPVVLARNIGLGSTTVEGRLTVSLREGLPEVIVLPRTSIAPGETVLLDLRDAWRRAASFDEAVAVGGEFAYNTAPGTVIMTAASVTTDLNHHFQVPMIDPETPPSSTGGYPWRADRTGTTVVYLKNTTTVPQQYVLQLTSEGGGYAPGLKTLPAGETVALDVRELRDRQVPDAFGRIIPAGASGGQIHWSAKGRERFAIIGRAEYVDLASGVSASYACLNCCPDHPYAWWHTPEVVTVGVGDTAQVDLVLQDEDCYSTQLEPYGLGAWYNWATWSIGNTSIATGNVNSLIVGEAEGTTTFSATWDNSAFYNVEATEWGWYCDPNWFPIEYEAETQAQEPTLTVSPSTVTRGQSATFTLAFPPGSSATLANWTISNWRFISDDVGQVTRASGNGSATWTGTIVAGGEVRVDAKPPLREQPLPPKAASVSVLARTGWAWAPAAIPTQETAGLYAFTVPPTTQTAETRRVGYSLLSLNSSFTWAAVNDSGPNHALKYLGMTTPIHSWQYELSPAIASSHEFFQKQCGNWNGATGFISGPQTRANTIAHEISDLAPTTDGKHRSHWSQYRAALLSSVNPGILAEAIVGTASDNAFSSQTVPSKMNAAFVQVLALVAPEPLCNPNANHNTACDYQGPSNYVPYQSCTDTGGPLERLSSFRPGGWPPVRPSDAAALFARPH